MQKILITGGCGYIGSHTIVDLINSGFAPISVDNLSNSDSVVLSQIEEITGHHVKNYQIDLRNLAALESVFEEEKEIVGVIHFAAFKAVGESVQIPLEYYDNNINGLINILKCQKKYGVKNHIFSSSCSIYGLADRLPVTEDAPIKEAESPYARTKQINEYLIDDFSVSHPEFRFILLRYFNPAGAHMSGLMGESPINPPQNLVPIITETAIGKRDKVVVFGDDYPTRDGSCIRDFIHVEDLGNAHTLALKNLLDIKQTSPIEIYNLGCGDGVSVLESIKAFQSATGETLNVEIGPRRPGDVIEIYANYSKANAHLGWEPKYSIEDIMRSAWEWEKKRS